MSGRAQQIESVDIGGEGRHSKTRSGGGCPILQGAASYYPVLPCRFVFLKHGLNDYSQVVRWEEMVWRIGRKAAGARESLRTVSDDSTLKRPNSDLNPTKMRTRKGIRMGRRKGRWRLGARRRREEPHSLMRLSSDRPDHRAISQVTVRLSSVVQTDDAGCKVLAARQVEMPWVVSSNHLMR